MTPARSWSDERLAELAGLPPDHPDVLAVREDPERWARLIALRAFLHPGPPPAGSRVEEAVSRIRTAVRDALDAGAEDPAPHARAAAPARPVRPARSWFAGWPAFAAAAAAVVVAVALLVPRALEHRGALRGTEGTTLVATARIEGDQAVFSWHGVAGAEMYELSVFGEDLTPLRPLLAVQDTVARLPLTELRGPDGRGSAVLWRVAAVRSGAPLAESRTVRLDLP